MTYCRLYSHSSPSCKQSKEIILGIIPKLDRNHGKAVALPVRISTVKKKDNKNKKQNKIQSPHRLVGQSSFNKLFEVLLTLKIAI